jgi:hypothetical protein
VASVFGLPVPSTPSFKGFCNVSLAVPVVTAVSLRDVSDKLESTAVAEDPLSLSPWLEPQADITKGTVKMIKHDLISFSIFPFIAGQPTGAVRTRSIK